MNSLSKEKHIKRERKGGEEKDIQQAGKKGWAGGEKTKDSKTKVAMDIKS